MIDYAAARLNMVESQIRTNKVTDPALVDAFFAVPRELFVPDELKGAAYIDEDIPLGSGRFLMEPMVLARLLQTAAVGPTDRVLDIGCGTGYAAAVLSRLVRSVVAVEEVAVLARRTAANLKGLDCANVTMIEGALPEGCKAHGPYDVVLIEGAVAAVPEAIAAQLVEGGRLVTVIRTGGEPGRAALMTRVGGVLSRRVVFDAGTPPLACFAAAPSFVF